MSLESAEDRQAFLDDEGEAVTTLAAVVPAIFRRGYVEASGFSGYAPHIMIADEDLAVAELAEGVALTVRGVTYVVRVVSPDGTGFTRLVLEES